MMTKQTTITLVLTQDETRWFANALALASRSVAETAPPMSRWRDGFRRGLEAKLVAPITNQAGEIVG